jgi:formyl-CoA transferase
LDLKDSRAKDIVYQLVVVSDVVVANFRPGVMERLGFGYDELRAINPRIICAYGTGYGLSGPDRDTLGQDMMAQCRAGLVRGNPPRTCGFNLCDQMGGFLLAQGVMVALAAREKTGRGQIVDSNLLNTAVVADSLGATGYLNSGIDESEECKKEKESRPRVGNPTYALYEAADGRWVHIIDAFRDRPLQRQCKALGIPDEVADAPRFADVHNLTPEAYEELRSHLAAGVARFTAEEVVARFREQDMMAVIVNTHRETFKDPQVLHNEMVLEARHHVAGNMRLVGFPIKLSDTPAALHAAPPLLGEHTGEVLGNLLGMDERAIQELCDAGVVGRCERSNSR